MAEIVLDSSAVLALLASEKGAERVRAALSTSVMSAVNVSEVIAKLMERGATSDQADAIMNRVPVRVATFDRDDANATGRLRPTTRDLGLSLGDRACLALALRLGADVLTTDREMAKAKVGVKIDSVR
ncbi:MAG: type II toxin-antitoxin system VapC family toxin [Hyphomonadaceae bacterium]|nr:type II toxin-antitoxin system VapC family toxin [Hyphomonadaceae bacterium]